MMPVRMAFLNALVSKPWTQENNCWHFVRSVRRELFGVDDLPIVSDDLVSHPERRREVFEGHPVRSAWAEVGVPQDGDIAIMSRPRDLHVGIYLINCGRGLVWHSDIGHGVVADTILEVTQLRRWKLVFFRRNS